MQYSKTRKLTQKKQVLCDLRVYFLIFNCQTPEGAFYSILATCSLKDAKNVEKKENYEESEQIVVHEIVK